MTIAIDIGNTRTKVSWFSADKMGPVHHFPTEELAVSLERYATQFLPETSVTVGWVSVAAQNALATLPAWRHFTTAPRFVMIDSRTSIPIKNFYATPATLGPDRIVAAIGAYVEQGGPVLVVDAGTAITYDFIDKEGAYRGGGIAPGIHLRFRALHEFTARLPLVTSTEPATLVGDSTVNSIRSGVINGTIAEVDGMINAYYDQYGPDLTTYLTGGDAPLFENQLKNLNFADANLILKGIHHILTYNSSL